MVGEQLVLLEVSFRYDNCTHCHNLNKTYVMFSDKGSYNARKCLEVFLLKKFDALDNYAFIEMSFNLNKKH